MERGVVGNSSRNISYKVLLEKTRSIYFACKQLSMQRTIQANISIHDDNSSLKETYFA